MGIPSLIHVIGACTRKSLNAIQMYHFINCTSGDGEQKVIFMLGAF